MRWQPLLMRLHSAWLLARIALPSVVIIMVTGMMLGWWPSSNAIAGIAFIWVGGSYQTRMMHGLRSSAILLGIVDRRGHLLADYWGVRVVAIGAVLFLVIPEIIGLALIWPRTFERSDLDLTLTVWLSSLSAVLLAVGTVATGLRYVALQTDRAARPYDEARGRSPATIE